MHSLAFDRKSAPLYGRVGHLSLWGRREIESLGLSKINSLDDDAEREWSEIESEYLVKFNAVDVTVDDLIALQEEVTRAPRWTGTWLGNRHDYCG